MENKWPFFCQKCLSQTMKTMKGKAIEYFLVLLRIVPISFANTKKKLKQDELKTNYRFAKLLLPA